MIIAPLSTDRNGKRSVQLPALVLSRICTSAIFMTYPACLDILLAAWRMTATQAGLVQGAFGISFAISLFAASLACDRFGARRVFIAAAFASAVTAILFAVFARSFETAIVFIALVGLTQGGTYTPAIMIVSANVPSSTKASAVGWVLAGMSAGYVLSIILSTSMVALADYRLAFAVTASITVLGWMTGYFAVRHAGDQTKKANHTDRIREPPSRQRARLLTLGYIGHCWELFGMWAWIPAFLATAVLSDGAMSAVELGLWTAVTLHASGFFASFLSGYAADRFGAKVVLVFFAAVGAACSLGIGWMTEVGVWPLLIVTAVYGFTTIGDSSVLSSAMTDAVPAAQLGRAFGIRSILGIGTGAVSPVIFGAALDSMPADTAWGYAFSTLAIGGLLALVCALALRR